MPPPGDSAPGVVRAIDIVELALETYGPPVYVKHEIVHNPYVVASLEAKGAITVEDVEEVPEDSVVVFSRHTGLHPRTSNERGSADTR